MKYSYERPQPQQALDDNDPKRRMMTETNSHHYYVVDIRFKEKFEKQYPPDETGKREGIFDNIIFTNSAQEIWHADPALPRVIHQIDITKSESFGDLTSIGSGQEINIQDFECFCMPCMKGAWDTCSSVDLTKRRKMTVIRVAPPVIKEDKKQDPIEFLKGKKIDQDSFPVVLVETKSGCTAYAEMIQCPLKATTVGRENLTFPLPGHEGDYFSIQAKESYVKIRFLELDGSGSADGKPIYKVSKRLDNSTQEEIKEKQLCPSKKIMVIEDFDTSNLYNRDNYTGLRKVIDSTDKKDYHYEVTNQGSGNNMWTIGKLSKGYEASMSKKSGNKRKEDEANGKDNDNDDGGDGDDYGNDYGDDDDDDIILNGGGGGGNKMKKNEVNGRDDYEGDGGGI